MPTNPSEKDTARCIALGLQVVPSGGVGSLGADSEKILLLPLFREKPASHIFIRLKCNPGKALSRPFEANHNLPQDQGEGQ